MSSWPQSALLVATLGAAQAAGFAGLARLATPRPWIGQITGSDMAIVGLLLMATPAMYVYGPVMITMVAFGVAFACISAMVLSLLLGQAAGLVAAALLVAVPVAGGLADADAVTYAGNDALILVSIIGVATMSVQLGAYARHVCWLAGALAVYDLVAALSALPALASTGRLPVTPFMPIFNVTFTNTSAVLALSEITVVVVWPLVLAKSFGRRPAVAGACVGLGATAAALLAGHVAASPPDRGYPVGAAAGAAIVIHFVLLRRSAPPERSVAQWRHAMSGSLVPAAGAMVDARPQSPRARQPVPGRWVAHRRGHWRHAKAGAAGRPEAGADGVPGATAETPGTGISPVNSMDGRSAMDGG